MKSIVIVVANGRVETVFSEEEVNVEIIDFDSCMCEEDESELADQVDICRASLYETLC